MNVGPAASSGCGTVWGAGADIRPVWRGLTAFKSCEEPWGLFGVNVKSVRWIWTVPVVVPVPQSQQGTSVWQTDRWQLRQLVRWCRHISTVSVSSQDTRLIVKVSASAKFCGSLRRRVSVKRDEDTCLKSNMLVGSFRTRRFMSTVSHGVPARVLWVWRVSGGSVWGGLTFNLSGVCYSAGRLFEGSLRPSQGPELCVINCCCNVKLKHICGSDSGVCVLGVCVLTEQLQTAVKRKQDIHGENCVFVDITWTFPLQTERERQADVCQVTCGCSCSLED